MVKCAVKGCRCSPYRCEDNTSFFRFPPEQKRFNKWMTALKRFDLINADANAWHNSGYRICSKHFLKIHFSSMLMNRLQRDAVPTKFPEVAGEGPYFEWVTDLTANSSDPNKSGGKSKNFGVNGENAMNPTIQTESEGSETEIDKEKNGEEKTEKENVEETVGKDAEKAEVDEEKIEDKEELSAEVAVNEEQPEGSENEKGVLEKLLTSEGNNEDEDDFDPSLLCPDISMDVGESSVVQPNDESEDPVNSNDDFDSNSLFTPLFSAFVDEMTGAEVSFNLSPEEQKLREKMYGPDNPVEFSKIHCTACNVHLGSALAGQPNRFVHPLLKVLICKECYHFYTSGEFEKDEDGSELYCRWCGQGGQVLCCSKCEYVFCKKCIRINFGRIKLKLVRESDDWLCFRCDMSQIKTMRATCVEFFEYIQKANARAAMTGDPDFYNKDLTTCCLPQNKKRSNDGEDVDKEVRRYKKRKDGSDDDPDYDPFGEEARSSAAKLQEKVMIPSTSTTPETVLIPNKNLPQLYPKPKPSELKTVGPNAPVMVRAAPPTSTIRIGNAILNVNFKPTNTAGKQIVFGPPMLRPILPNKVVKTVQTLQNPMSRVPTVPSPRPVLTPVKFVMPHQQGKLSHQPQQQQAKSSQERSAVKHDWFDKTVRAAARVNSNLSYTLTHLNKSQASATSVEQLAVVHNKLQEVLSGSINSLIQIRKNLRTEFIAGIKTVKFPPKTQAQKSNNNNDDDVVIVNPTPPRLKVAPTTQRPNMPQSYPKNTVRRVERINGKPPTGFLKVRSLSALQNVPSECITIPDDDETSVSSDKMDQKKSSDEEEIEESETNVEETPKKDEAVEEKNDVENEKDDDVGKEKDDDVEKKKDDDVEKEKDDDVEKEKVEDKTVQEKNGEDPTPIDCVKVKEEKEDLTFNVKEKPCPKVKRMLSVKVNLKKVPIIEEKVKEEPVENGDEQ